MGCGMSMVKYILFIFNLICALCGIAVLAVGIGFLLKYDNILKAFEDLNVNVAPVLFIIVGSAIFLIAFFGCCGAIRESHCMVSTYAGFLFVLLVVQIVIGVLVFTNVAEVQRAAERFLRNLWKNRSEHKIFWDNIQRSLQCCGLNSALEWVPNTPPSCCEPNVIECVALVNAYQTGCSQRLNEFIGSTGNVFGSVALIVAGVQLVGFIFACCLANNIRNHSRRYA